MVCKISQGAAPVDRPSLPQGAEQVFLMSEDISNTQKEDLAWATYVLLRNTNTIAVVCSSSNYCEIELSLALLLWNPK